MLHKNEAPYPYILGGQSEARDEDAGGIEATTYDPEKGKDLGASAPVKLQLKKIDTSWIYSMPFGKHNAAIPEMKYKLPEDSRDKPTKLSYFDVIDKKKDKNDNEEAKDRL